MIVPTRRLGLVALAGLPLAGLARSPDGAVLTALLWSALVTLLAVLDARLAAPGRLRWERRHDARFTLAAPNAVTLHLTNHSARPANFHLRDAAPPAMVAEGAEVRGNCAAGASWERSYTLLPRHRGAYLLGPLSVRVLGPLRFAWKQTAALGDDPVTVYPNLVAIQRYEALIRRAHLSPVGARLVRTPELGMEFERLRDYSPDDEFRRINWPATARLHRPIATDYQTERSQTILLALDAGRVMGMRVPAAMAGFPVALSKLDLTIQAALLVAYVSQRYNDRVGLLAFADQPVRQVVPRAGRTQFLTLTHALHDLEPSADETDFGTGLGQLTSQSSRRSLVILFTDLWEPEATSTLVAHVAHLARRHLVLVVSLRDPEIERLATLEPADSERLYRRAVARSLLDERAAILRRMELAGVLALDVPAAGLSTAVVNRYLELKERGRL